MLSSFYTDKGGFINYTTEHYVSVLVCLALSAWLFIKGKQLTYDKALKLAFNVTVFIAFTQLFKVFVRLYLGNFDIKEDLPLQLCNMMPFLLLFAYYKNSQTIFRIIAFWIMAGTLQAVFTPTLTERLPHYEAIRYWIIHVGLPVMVVYSIIVLKWRLRFKDILFSALAINVLAFFMYQFNRLIDANYVYVNAKPPGKTLYSILPEWPTYILCLEGIVLILFSVVYLLFLPFYKRGQRI